MTEFQKYFPITQQNKRKEAYNAELKRKLLTSIFSEPLIHQGETISFED